MNRILSSIILKSALTFIVVLFNVQVFGVNYFSVKDGDFDEITTWSTSSSLNTRPSSIDFNDGRNNFTIRNGDKVTISSNLAISINNLSIQGNSRNAFSQLIIKSTVNSIQINGILSIIYGSIVCGTENVNIIVTGDLKGGIDSGFEHSPLIGKTQTLTLNGLSNILELYQTNAADLARAGTSKIIYSGSAGQSIFASEAYSLLTISGRGEKVLSGDITVANGLSISDTYLQLGTFSLTYAGTEAGLITTNGWVYTNSTGVYKNSNISGTTKTFPVGNATSMQKITLSDGDVGSKVIGIRFVENSRGLPLGTGMGHWQLNTLTATTFKATINPLPSNTRIITNTSQIASYSEAGINPDWQVQPSTFSSTDASYTSDTPFNIIGGNTWFMLYNCPTYTITPASIPISYVGDIFNDKQFFVNSDAVLARNLTIDVPLNNFTFTAGVLKSKQTPPIPPKQTTSFTLTYTDNVKCSVQQSYTIKIIDLPSPNLSILTIDAKTFDSDSFRVRTYSRSTGTIRYSISPTTQCASIDLNTGFVKIKSCASPATNNQYTVTATQDSDGITYRGESVSKSFIINPAPGRLYVKNFAFLQNSANAPIKTATKSTGAAITFEQLTGFNEATVSAAGIVDPHQTGEFTVRISLAATSVYTAFDSVYTFNVYTLNKPPLAIGDTIALEMGKDTTFNILQNDQGQTGEIIPNETDVDIENRGQQLKYYATELGNFIIDTAGNLTVRPFYGFIGSGRLGYTVTDNNGQTSEIAYVEVTINPPYVVPELKVNTTMTPNGDNLNDALVIANTDLSKENSLIILDEIGNTVYETTNYQNNWEGIDKKGNKVEPGVYFYTFKEKASGREMNNYIQIVK